MSRFENFLEACDGSGKMDGKGKKKQKRKGKMDEAQQKLVFSGYHLKDNILDDITVEELFEMVDSNLPKEKINKMTVQKEFDNLLKMKLSDAKFIAKKVIPELVKEIIKYKE